MCIYICEYILRMYIYICNTSIYVNTHYLCTYINKYVYMYLYVCINIHIYIHIFVHMQTYTYVYIYLYI